MKKYLLLLLVFLTGCTTPLYESRDHVGIHLYGEPTVEEDSYKLQMKFESPTDDPQIIQWVGVGNYLGVEAFRSSPGYKTYVDTHFIDESNFQHRRMTLAPGKVEGVDATFWGFSMLPSEWPDNFNAHYRENHEIQGRVVYRKPEHETVYFIHFENGVLSFWIEGHEDDKREWRAEGK